jgi:hypothetical protein
MVALYQAMAQQGVEMNDGTGTEHLHSLERVFVAGREPQNIVPRDAISCKSQGI